MELRHLRHFIAVAEELHFARAAERLGMEQSPLSHSIKNLETELGVQLFHRTSRRTWLTRAGVRFHAEASRVLEAVEIARAAARNEELEQRQRITVGLAEHAAGEPFTRFLFELEHRHPPISVDLREVAPAEAVRLVTDRVLDLAIVLEPVGVASLRCVRAWGERLALIAPLGHPLAERDRVSLAEVASERFVMPNSTVSPGYAGQIQALLSSHGVRQGSRRPVKHQNTMISLASAGRGLAILPESVAHGLTAVAVLPLGDHAEIVSWLVYRDEEASPELSFALEVAAVIDAGGELAADAADAP